MVEVSPQLAPSPAVSVEPFEPKEYQMVLKDLHLMNGSNSILKGVTFAVENGKLLGILGESGAGKTTLLRLLARKLNETVLNITGQGLLPKEIWFIAQEDVLYEFDTPRRVVAFLHQLLYAEGLEKANEVAGELLKKVHFPTSLADRQIGTMDHGLSVGARRLLNVALALCSKAKVILLDEPTTGLDSTTAANLVSVLKEVCSSLGCTAVCTIHQPSDEALIMFDEIIVMNEGMAYGSTYEAAKESLQSLPASGEEKEEDLQLELQSRAEVLLQATKRHLLPQTTLPVNWTAADDERYCSGDSFKDQLSLLENMYEVPLGRQSWLLLQRFAIRNWENPFALRFRFAIVTILAILIGVCFYDLSFHDPRNIRDIFGVFMAVIGTTFVPIVVSAGFFPAEKPSLLNELSQSKRYDLGPYLICRTLFDMIVALLCSGGAFIIAGMVGIPRLWERFWFSLLLQSFNSDSFGFLLSVRFPPEIAIPALIPTVAFLSVLVGTAVAAPEEKDSGWIFHSLKHLSFFKYGFTALASDQFPFITGSCAPGTDRCSFANSDAAMKAFGLVDPKSFVGSFRLQWIVLVGFLLTQRLGCYLLLRGIVASSKFTYKAATNWDQKKAADEEKRLAAGEASPTVDPVPTPAVTPTTAAQSALVEVPVDPEGGAPLKKSDHLHSFIGSSVKGRYLELQWNIHIIASHSTGMPLIGETTEKILLHPQTGKTVSGEVLGVLGPASCGKTVLLKALCWQLPISGFVKDGSTVDVTCAFDAATDDPFVPGVRFVYQNDAFIPGDTVSSAIKRQLGFAMKEDPKTFDDSVRSILRVMSLSHVADKRADEISGGQMRRLSIACQLAHRPSITLLDEPTSGLDSELALEVIACLRKFARSSNAIVICTLNQPGKRLLPCVDQFLFLAQGHAVFHGSLHEATEHFQLSSEDIAERCLTDVILERLRHVTPPVAPSASPRPTQPTESVGTVFHPRNSPALSRVIRMSPSTAYQSPSGVGPFLTRMRLILQRNAESRLANPVQYFLEQLLKFVAFLLVLAILFIQVKDDYMVNRMGLILVVNAAVGFVAFMTPVILFSRDRVVFERETRAGDYSPLTYQMARWMFESPVEIAFLTVGSVALFYIVGFKGNVGIFIGSHLLCYLSCYGFGSVLAALPFSVSVNGGIGAFMIVVMMLGGDFVVTPHQIDRMKILYACEVFSPVRHGLVLDILNEADASPIGSILMGSLGLNRSIDKWGPCWGMLAGNFLLFRILAILFSWGDVALERWKVGRMYRTSESGSTSANTQ